MSAPPPPHRSALEACRSQLHVRARALHQPLFCHFLGPPVSGPILDSAGGIRTHGLELMRLARTAAPLPRKSGWQESNLRSPAPEAGGVTVSPTASRSSSGGRARTCALAINSRASYRLDHAGTKSGGSRTRTCERTCVRLRGSNALPCQLGHASSGRRGSRTPKAAKPTRFRDGIPRRWQSFREWPGRRRTCNPPLKRRQLCQLSYGAVM